MADKFHRFFPTVVSQGRLAGAVALNRRLLKAIRSLSSQDRLGHQWSKENYRGGYTSYASLSDLQYRSPEFAEFADKLAPHVEAFAKAQDWDLRGMKLVMTACWMNVMPENTYHTLHLHPHSVISGAYYVSAPPGSVALKIEDPRMGLYMNAPLRKRGGLYQTIEPKAGSFVLFESWLRHEVPPNRSKQPRIGLSFNYSLEADDDE